MSNIIRTPHKVAGGITAQEKRLLDAHAKKWIDNALSTEPTDHVALKAAIEQLYEVSGLKKPRVVIVPSPLVMAFAGGFSSAIWWQRKNATRDATYEATYDATRDATRDATYEAARDATDDATRVATDDATRVATDDATDDATYEATYEATDVATDDATRVATDDATDDATYEATYEATRDATDDAADVATYEATYDATRDATRDATYEAARDATDDATRVATDDATDDATYEATYEATYDATRDATYEATYDATRDATRDATYEAARDATYDATRYATRVATYYATDDAADVATRYATRVATDDATRYATDVATRYATYVATDVATRDATYDPYAKSKYKNVIEFSFGISTQFSLPMEFIWGCVRKWFRPYQGGNMWASFECYLTAMRDVLGLQLPEHEKYAAWEACAKLGGFRWMHEEFCIVTERPVTLLTDDNGRPHGDGEPSHQWRDGFFINFWHGVRLPDDVWNSQMTVEKINSESNVEVKRAYMEIYGMDNYLRDINAVPIDVAEDSHNPIELFSLPDSELPIVRVVNSSPEPDGSYKNYVLTSPVHTTSARAAVAALAGTDPQYYQPLIES